MGAARKGADAGEDGGLVEAELVARDRLVVEDGEFAARVDLAGVGVVGDGGAYDGRPVFADGVLGGGAADLVGDEQLFEQGGEGAGGAFDLAGGGIVGHAAKGGHELARDVGDGFFGGRGHGGEKGAGERWLLVFGGADVEGVAESVAEEV